MKEYIKPQIMVLSVASESMIAASPTFSTDNIGSENPEIMGAGKNHKPNSSLWDETWDSDDDESNE